MFKALGSSTDLTSSALRTVVASSTFKTSGNTLCGFGTARFAPKSEVSQPFAAAQLVNALIETILLVKVDLATPVL